MHIVFGVWIHIIVFTIRFSSMNTGAGWSNLDPLCNIGLCNIELDAYCETVGIVQGSKTGKWQKKGLPNGIFFEQSRNKCTEAKNTYLTSTKIHISAFAHRW
jgi:hypothetical protein